MEGILAALASNAMSEMHAGKQYEREANLMNKQNAMNQENVLGAYQNQVNGMKMAGLSPAGAMNQAPSVASVSKGSVGMAENVELTPELLLMDAQRENIEADTAKKRAEIGNIDTDTSKKTAEIFYTKAGTKKVEEETQNIKNINETYADTNKQLNPMGQALAQKWQAMEWYNKLSPESKEWIDSVASGNEKLTIGGMDALHKIIQSQKELSDADRSIIKNAFDNSISEAMYNDPDVMEALAKAPLNEQNKIKAQINNLVADTAFTDKKKEDLINRIQSFVENDLGYLASKGEWGKYLREVFVQKIVGPLAAGIAGGGALTILSKLLGKGGKTKGKNGMDQFDDYMEQTKRQKDAWDRTPDYKNPWSDRNYRVPSNDSPKNPYKGKSKDSPLNPYKDPDNAPRSYWSNW